MKKTTNLPSSLHVLVRLLLAITIIFILIMTRQLLVPLFFSVLFSYALYPAARSLESRGIPRILTNLILILTSILFIGGIIYGLILLIVAFSEDLPQIKKQISENMMFFQQLIESSLGVSEQQLESISTSVQESGQYIGQLFTATANTILIIGLIPVYTFLMLFYRNKFRTFVSMTSASDHENIVNKILDQTADVVPQYMKGLFIVCMILIVINSAGFYLIGVKYALLLGIIAAIFNLIPYLGTIIGYGIAFLFVMVTQSPTIAFYVVLQFFVVQFFENNILTPNITGSYVQINPLVTILALIAGGMIWGLPGMFMIIPYLAIIKIVCENIPDLKPVSYLLGNRGVEQHSIPVKSIKEKLGFDTKQK